MNKSENYLDQLLNAVDDSTISHDSSTATSGEEEKKEHKEQKSAIQKVNIPDSEDVFLDQFEQELRREDDSDEFLRRFEEELNQENQEQGVTKATQPMLDNIDQIMESVSGKMEEGPSSDYHDESLKQEIDETDIGETGINDFGMDAFGTEEADASKGSEQIDAKPEEDDELMKMLNSSGEPEQGEDAVDTDAHPEPEADGEEGGQQKKKGFLAKLSAFLFGSEEEEEVSGQGQAEASTAENADILNDMDNTSKESAAQKKKEKKEKKEQKKKEKQEKKAQKEKTKKAKPKKEKKPKPAAEPDHTPPLPRVPVILIFVMATSILVLVLTGTHLFGYSDSFSSAKQSFAEGRYAEAFEAVAGEKVKEKDADTYEKYRITAMVAAEYDAYESMMDAEVYDMALDSLIRTIQRYDKYVEDAGIFGCRDELDRIEAQAEEALQQNFGISAEDARAMYSSEDKKAYSTEIYHVLEAMGLSEVEE